MPEERTWLPPLAGLDEHAGDWDSYLKSLYAAYIEDFVISKPKWNGKNVGHKRHPLVDGKAVTFWHLITIGEIEAERIPDMRRCERIRWPRAIIENHHDAGIKVWEERHRGSEWRVHIWLEQEDYVVVLARRKVGKPDEYVLLWTAYVVERSHVRRKLQQRFDKWSEKG